MGCCQTMQMLIAKSVFTKFPLVRLYVHSQKKAPKSKAQCNTPVPCHPILTLICSVNPNHIACDKGSLTDARRKDNHKPFPYLPPSSLNQSRTAISLNFSRLPRPRFPRQPQEIANHPLTVRGDSHPTNSKRVLSPLLSRAHNPRQSGIRLLVFITNVARRGSN